MAGWGIIMLDITFLYLKCLEYVNIFWFDKTSWFEFSPFGLWWYELTDKEVCHNLTILPCYQEWSFKMYRFHKRCWRPLLLYKSWRAFSDPEDDHLQKRWSNLLTEYRQRSRSPQQRCFCQKSNVLGVGLVGVEQPMECVERMWGKGISSSCIIELVQWIGGALPTRQRWAFDRNQYMLWIPCQCVIFQCWGVSCC